MSPESPAADPFALNQYREYLRILASQQAALRLQGKVDLSLMLHYWTGWTLAQIADQIGRSREAVAGLIKRGLRQLRLELN